MKERLLIVDDEPSIRMSMTHLFTELGCSVRSAEDGFSALRHIRSELPEIILSDLNMPGMSGFELLSHPCRIGQRYANSGFGASAGVVSIAQTQAMGMTRVKNVRIDRQEPLTL